MRYEQKKNSRGLSYFVDNPLLMHFRVLETCCPLLTPSFTFTSSMSCSSACAPASDVLLSLGAFSHTIMT